MNLAVGPTPSGWPGAARLGAAGGPSCQNASCWFINRGVEGQICGRSAEARDVASRCSGNAFRIMPAPATLRSSAALSAHHRWHPACAAKEAIAASSARSIAAISDMAGACRASSAANGISYSSASAIRRSSGGSDWLRHVQEPSAAAATVSAAGKGLAASLCLPTRFAPRWPSHAQGEACHKGALGADVSASTDSVRPLSTSAIYIRYAQATNW